MIKPILEQLEEEYAGKLNIAQINTDENQVHVRAKPIRMHKDIGPHACSD